MLVFIIKAYYIEGYYLLSKYPFIMFILVKDCLFYCYFSKQSLTLLTCIKKPSYTLFLIVLYLELYLVFVAYYTSSIMVVYLLHRYPHFSL